MKRRNNTFRRNQLAGRWLIALALTVTALSATGADCDNASVETTAAQAATRTHYFDGRFLPADDLAQEQNYHRDH